MSESDLNPVSVTQGDRVLTGVGADPERLAETMERHAPDEPVEQPAQPSPEPVQKESRGAKRIAQITKEREEERERREAVEKERDELRTKLNAQVTPVSTPKEEPKPVPVAEKPADTRTKPKESDVGTKYETYADFIEDLADWKAEQRLAAIDLDARISHRIEGDRAARTQADHVAKAMERGRAAYADFNAVLQSPHMLAANWPADKIAAIANLEEPEHVQYALGKDATLAEKLRTASPVQFGMELAKLIPAPAVVTQASTAGAGTVTPPPPFQPVGAGGKSTAPPLADLVKKGGYDFDKSGYREKRAAELGRGIRRR